MSELPETWTECTLGEVVNYGATTKVEPNDIPDDSWILELEDIEKDTSQIVQRLTFKERDSKSTKNQFEKGDVLYGKLRPYLNKVVVADSDGFCTTEIIPLKAGGALDSCFLFYWLKHPRFLDYVTAVSHGLNMPRLGTDAGKAAPFVLAPLPEQKRIADKLEAVLGRVGACRARLARVPDLLKRFRQSVLAAATSGRLTEDWRKSRGIHIEQWGAQTLGAVCESGRIITYGVIKLGDEIEDGVPCLRTSNVRWLHIDTDGMKRIAPSLSADYSRTILRGGEVLVNVRGTLGGVAVAEVSMSGWNVSREVAVVPVKQTILIPAFLAYLIGSEKTQSWLTGVQKGVAYTGINIEDLRMLPLHIPSIDEQQEIVRRVETLFAFADRIEARLNEAQTIIARLTPSTLAKAFRGELVPQDLADEPASALLARLRATRSAAPAPKRRGRPAASLGLQTEGALPSV